jgi:hypothetical protein
MKKILAIAVATAISAPAMADLTVGGNAEYKITGGDSDTTTSLETNLTVAGSAEANGVSVSAFTEFEVVGAGDTGGAANASNLDIDDQYIQIGVAGATITLAPQGGFASKDAFGTGPDTAHADVAVYGAASSERAKDIAVDFAAGSVAVQVAGNIADSDEMSVYASTTVAEGVSVAASYEDYATGTGYGLNASVAMGEVTLGANYAANDADESATILTAAYGDFAIASASSEGTSDVYGTYTTAVGPATLTLGAGNSESVSKVVAKLNYTF